MSARVERYRVEDREEGFQAPSSRRVSLPSRTPETSLSVPDVPVDLLQHLRERFPNKAPDRSECSTPERALIAVAEAWGTQKVIEYLEHLLNQKNENNR